MLPYGIGLDIGIGSVGWAVVALDSSEKPCGILDMGVRVFPSPEHPKTGASPAAPRREARSARRRLRRHRHRNQRIRHLLIASGILSEAQLETLFSGQLEDIYLLRVRALDEVLSPPEFARVLIHISQRRGFRSNRKNAVTKEDGVLLAAVNQNLSRMTASGYRTVGEMLLRDPLFADSKRNKDGAYLATVSRDMITDEVRQIFAAQRRMGAEFASEATESAYLEILLSQRSFDEGPGGNSPYGGDQIAKMVGQCSFLSHLPRAAKATYSFEYFSLLEKINHLRLMDDSSSHKLNPQQREALIALAHKTDNPNFGQIRSALEIPAGCSFNMVRYADKPREAAEKAQKLGCLRAYHQLRKAIDKTAKGRFQSLSLAHKNALGTALTLYKTSSRIHAYLQDAELASCDIEAADTLGSFSKFGHLSVDACNAIIPYLEQGMDYTDACKAAGFQPGNPDDTQKQMLLHPSQEDYADLTSPVAQRAVSQAIKVINAIIRRHGYSPSFLHIELAREMSKDFSERKQMDKQMQDNQARNQRILQRIHDEFGVQNPTGQDLVKFKLYEEQQGVCPYSQTQLSLPRLFEPNYAEVDHIVPYSISFDDSYKNKVLVLAGENRQKGNRLPLQYLSGQRADSFTVWVNSAVRDRRKRQLLLKAEITQEDQNRFIERNLQDTRTISRFLHGYLLRNLQFAPSSVGRRKHVTAVNGTITAYMRKRLGISKIRANGDLHHAVDALVVACTTDAMIQQITRHTQFRECLYVQGDGESMAVDRQTGALLRSFPHPWPQFRKELEARLSSNPAHVLNDFRLPMYVSGQIPLPAAPIFVSRMPTRKITGAAHKDTVKSPKILDQGFTIVKRPLTDLTLKNLENYYAPESDRLLYDAIRARLLAFGGDGKKAFAEPFYKPKSDGSPGPLVRKVKLKEPFTTNVAVHGGEGVADHDAMVRTDVFYVEGEGYYMVPIYVADTRTPILPTQAATPGKPYIQWKQMQADNFLFSLYPNDLIRITRSKPITFHTSQKDSTLEDTYAPTDIFVYYAGLDISTASIKCITHDNAYFTRGLGVKTLDRLEKYTVDVLGEYHRVEKEKRQSFSMKRG